MPEELANIIIRTLHKDPERRYSSAAEMDTALSTLQRDLNLAQFDVSSTPGKPVDPSLIHALKDIFKPQTLKIMLHRPSGGYVLGRNLPTWVVLTIMFLLALILTLVSINLLNRLLA